jgi:anhydro-N-acetylmuramic acid kinase
MAAEGLFVGLMSGTSVDGVDAVLVRIVEDDFKLLATHSEPYSDSLTDDIRRLSRGDEDGLHQLATLDRRIARAFASAVVALLHRAGVEAPAISAIGSHGQTVRHNPCEDLEARYTVQLGDPSTIAEATGIAVVADFRRRDIAAGGEGAPLVPAFHAARFGLEGRHRAIVNIGGIANATLLDGKSVAGGFDCGPGNTLLDAWIREQRGDAYDSHGAWSAEHESDGALLARLLDDAYLHRSGPRSTGPEHFSLAWLRERLPAGIAAGTVQATLCEFTASAIADSLRRDHEAPQEVYVCGGGARNTDLMRRLHRHLFDSDTRLGTTDELGLDAEWVEAAAFAWLAQRRMAGLPGNAPEATGAVGPRVLGGIYAA